MEKVGVDKETLHSGLLNEEANIMQEIQAYMTIGEKTASERQKEQVLNDKLSSVRAKITEIDLGPNRGQ